MNIEVLRLRANISRDILRRAKEKYKSREILEILARHHIDNIVAYHEARWPGKKIMIPTVDKLLGRM